MKNFDTEYKNARVLVTGAGGFIGGHLTTRLANAGAKVTALLKYNSEHHKGGILGDIGADGDVTFAYGNVADPEFIGDLVKDGAFDYVFHLAALISIPYSYEAPRSYVETNVLGTQNVLEAVTRNKVRRVVHTSTSEVYGTALYTPIDEKHPYQAQSPYSATKISADMMAESYRRSFDTPVVVIRPFNTFGPYQSQRAVIPSVIAQIASGANELKMGDASPVRDFNFVDNTVEGFLAGGLAPDEALGEIFNLASGKGVTIGEMVEMVMDIAGRRVTITTDAQRLRPGKSEVFNLIGDCKKAKDLLGWEPRIDFAEGLARTYEFIASRPDKYSSHEYKR